MISKALSSWSLLSALPEEEVFSFSNSSHVFTAPWMHFTRLPCYRHLLGCVRVLSVFAVGFVLVTPSTCTPSLLSSVHFKAKWLLLTLHLTRVARANPFTEIDKSPNKSRRQPPVRPSVVARTPFVFSSFFSHFLILLLFISSNHRFFLPYSVPSTFPLSSFLSVPGA